MDAQIEDAARELQTEIWRHKHQLCPLGCAPVDLLHPKYAATVLGYDYDEVPEISDWPPGRPMRIAGLVDPQRSRVVVSEAFGVEVARFTGAHEIGHIVLGPPVSLLRERPMEGPSEARTGIERDADKYASYHLMPERLVWTELGQTLGIVEPIRVDEDVAFWLDPTGYRDLPEASLRTKSRAIAASRRDIAGRSVTPLHGQLRVSVTALAIRLEELGVISD